MLTGGGGGTVRRTFSPVNGRDRSRGMTNDGWRVAHNTNGGQTVRPSAQNLNQV
jgi:hypothetical protein